MNLKIIFKKNLNHLRRIIVIKIIYKYLVFILNYLGYINDIIFRKKLKNDVFYRSILLRRIEKVNFNLIWQPILNDKIKDKIMEKANKIKDRIFSLLGSGEIKVDYKLRAKGLGGHRYDMKLSKKEYLVIKERIQLELKKIFQKPLEYEPIDWQVDFKSGYRWSEKTYYKFIRYSHKLGVDIKLPWELSRAQHLLSLALVYRSTKKDEYAEEIIKQILDWNLNNRYKFGVNWRCTMDVAIRVSNWLIAINLIKDYIDNLPSAGKEYFCKMFFKRLYQHGDFIIHNLEWSKDLTSNHYLSDIAGLLLLAIFTENVFKEAREWKEFATKKLKNEMFKQVYNDGTDFEGSTCYHHLALELFFYSTFFAVQNEKYKVKNVKEGNLSSLGDYKTIAEEIFGVEYVARLYRMFDAILYLLKPNGRMPQIGDNDSGQFIKLYPREVLDMRYLLSLGAVFFKESKWKIREFFNSDEDIAEILILFGEKGKSIWDSLEWNSLKNINSKAFNNSGWYVMRNNKDYCIISCEPNGQNGNGGHAHNDKLSFELMLNGKDIIIDPGTFIYTPYPEWRNKFRSTLYHNTLIIQNVGQNKILKDHVFGLIQKIQCRCINFSEYENRIIFEGGYFSYVGKTKEICQRLIIFHKIDKSIYIKDKILVNIKNKEYYQNFIFHPKISLEDVKIECQGNNFINKECYYSLEYGKKVKTKCLKNFGLITKICLKTK